MQRRGFLKLGLFGGVILLVGGTGLAIIPTKRGFLPKRALVHFTDDEFAILAAIAARMITVPDGDPVEIAHFVDGSLGAGSPEAQRDFKKLLHLIESGLAGLLLDGRPQNFTRLPPEGQDAALFAFRDSRLAVRRSGYHAVRKLCQASYYARDSSWAAIGYPGPPQIVAPVAPKEG